MSTQWLLATCFEFEVPSAQTWFLSCAWSCLWSCQAICLHGLLILLCATPGRPNAARKGGIPPLFYQQSCLLWSGCLLFPAESPLEVFQIIFQHLSASMALTLALVRSKLSTQLNTFRPLWLWSLAEISLVWKLLGRQLKKWLLRVEGKSICSMFSAVTVMLLVEEPWLAGWPDTS